MTTPTDSPPAWLVAWKAERSQDGPRRRENGLASLGFFDPEPWDADGGVRREPVLDTDCDPPRVVRYVGWRVCMNCRRQFWSEDVRAIRMCGRCKAPDQ